MNEGVKILLERIKTNPEEFIYNPSTGMSRWQRLVDHALADEIATEEEEKALKDALRDAKRDRFTELVMKELLAPEEDDNLGKWFTERAKGTALGGVTLGAYSNMATLTNQTNGATGTWANGLTTNSAYQQAQAQQAIEIQQTRIQQILETKKQMDLEKYKAKQVQQTLVGRLKNYLHSDE